jgi:hypothetical protein
MWRPDPTLALAPEAKGKSGDLTPDSQTPFGQRLRAKGMAPKAVVGAAMRKLAHLIYGVVSSGMPFDANLAGMRVDFQDGI